VLPVPVLPVRPDTLRLAEDDGAGADATANPVTLQYPSSIVPVQPGSGQGIAGLAGFAGVVMAAVPVR
jgi:hypothetical protein